MRLVKQYGLQRSGTNVVKLLIEEASAAGGDPLTVLTHIGGNKHDPIPPRGIPWADARVSDAKNAKALCAGAAAQDAAGGVPLLLCAKNPAAWLASIRRYRREPVTIEEAAALYNTAHRSWLAALRARGGALVRYEELLADPDKTIRAALRALGAKEPEGAIVLPKRRLKRGGQVLTRANGLTVEPFSPGYYTKRRYLGGLRKPTRKALRAALDSAVLRQLGYTATGLA